MDFEWDQHKSQVSTQARGFDFEFVARLFDRPVFQAEDRRRDYGERRMIAIGELEGKIYKVVFTDRGAVRRIISAHRASRQEKRTWQSFVARGQS